MTNFITVILLTNSILISTFFFLNRSAFFSKLGINRILLVRLSERRNLHLTLSTLFLLYPLVKIITGDDQLTLLFWIAVVVIFMIIIFELIGFPGIFKAINNPEFVDYSELDDTTKKYLEVSDIIGIEINGVTRAYPIEPLRMNHVVNDTIGNVKFAITHCALCNSTHVFNRVVNDVERRFHAAVPIIRSNLVLADQSTNLWQQLSGEGLSGNAVGHDLEKIPSITTSWNHWKKLHPDTKILKYKHTGLLKIGNLWFSKLINIIRNKDSSPLFPTGNNDNRYSPKAPIIGLIINKIPIALPLEKIPDKFEVKIQVKNMPVWIFHNREEGIHGAFYVPLDPDSLSYDLSFDLQQKEIFSGDNKWDIMGKSLTNQASLKPAKMTYPLYWFAWIGTYPDSLIFEDISELEQNIAIVE